MLTPTLPPTALPPQRIILFYFCNVIHTKHSEQVPDYYKLSLTNTYCLLLDSGDYGSLVQVNFDCILEVASSCRYVGQGPFQGLEDTLWTRAPRFHSCSWCLYSSFTDTGKMGCPALETSQLGNPLLRVLVVITVTQGWIDRYIPSLLQGVLLRGACTGLALAL